MGQPYLANRPIVQFGALILCRLYTDWSYWPLLPPTVNAFQSESLPITKDFSPPNAPATTNIIDPDDDRLLRELLL